MHLCARVPNTLSILVRSHLDQVGHLDVEIGVFPALGFIGVRDSRLHAQCVWWLPSNGHHSRRRHVYARACTMSCASFAKTCRMRLCSCQHRPLQLSACLPARWLSTHLVLDLHPGKG